MIKNKDLNNPPGGVFCFTWKFCFCFTLHIGRGLFVQDFSLSFQIFFIIYFVLIFIYSIIMFFPMAYKASHVLNAHISNVYTYHYNSVIIVFSFCY